MLQYPQHAVRLLWHWGWSISVVWHQSHWLCITQQPRTASMNWPNEWRMSMRLQWPAGSMLLFARPTNDWHSWMRSSPMYSGEDQSNTDLYSQNVRIPNFIITTTNKNVNTYIKSRTFWKYYQKNISRFGIGFFSYLKKFMRKKELNMMTRM